MMTLYKIEYQERSGNWISHSGHLPLPEREALTEAKWNLFQTRFVQARLVHSENGSVYTYVKVR